MGPLVSFLLLLLVAAVQAISSSGDRLLVILEDVGDKAKYSKFLGDLEGTYARVLTTRVLLKPLNPMAWHVLIQCATHRSRL